MKTRYIINIIFLFVCITTFAQGKYATKTGQLDFEASVPAFEEVKANNENVSAIFNTETGDLAVLALMKGFRFKVALMEEHFNENYIESSKYPKAIFRGKLKGFVFSSVTENEQQFMVTGMITMHGQEKAVEVPIFIKMQDEMINLKTNFTLNPADFNIEIPKIVSNKISESVDVSAIFSLKKK